ncbi:molecular chaperone FimC [Shewanella algae]|uniref:fimbrial biogenesis chaperone n=1 Tax=Shewanella algae TaxID=38313 RepID=UPI001BF0EE2A|nr:fimbria/pilus periplasmic chaperone [Shewanella algae]BCV34428.1 molecular chaperone FimC [Shewanella algae]
MSKFKFKTFMLSNALLLSFSANSALTLDGTRYIYNSDVNAIPVTVANQADRLFGGQIWLEQTSDTGDIPFAVVPNVFALEKGAKQVVQLSALESRSLSQTQESMFWLNLQEVPSKDKGMNVGNALVMAARIKVKLLYRPESIKKERKHAEEKIRLQRDGASLVISNPTPYYFAVISVAGSSTSSNSQLTSFAPFSQLRLELPEREGDTIDFRAIDDWGAVNKFSCQLLSTGQQCQFVKAEPIIRDDQ